MEALFSLCTFYLTLLILLHHLAAPSLAQSSLAPSPPGPPNVTAILEKNGQFVTFMRLLKLTQMTDQINNQLNNSNQGLTLFVPPDNAFSELKPGTLNSLTDQQKVSLVQFHVIPSFISMSQFQTVSNPIRTQAGSSNSGDYPLNVTTSGNNQVNISTGVDDATVANTIYSDGKFAVYQINKVLLPRVLFGPPAPAPAPSSAKPKKKAKSTSAAADGPSTDDGSADTSGAGPVDVTAMGAILAAAVVEFWLNL